MSVHQANTIVPLTATVLMSWVHISALASLDLLAMVKFAKVTFILYKSAKLWPLHQSCKTEITDVIRRVNCLKKRVLHVNVTEKAASTS